MKLFLIIILIEIKAHLDIGNRKANCQVHDDDAHFENECSIKQQHTEKKMTHNCNILFHFYYIPFHPLTLNKYDEFYRKMFQEKLY